MNKSVKRSIIAGSAAAIITKFAAKKSTKTALIVSAVAGAVAYIVTAKMQIDEEPQPQGEGEGRSERTASRERERQRTGTPPGGDRQSWPNNTPTANDLSGNRDPSGPGLGEMI